MPVTLTYILQDTTPVAEPNPAVWQTWMQAALTDGRRVVAQAEIDDRLKVSTVFTGIDQSLASPHGFDRPVVFETAVFEDGQLAETQLYDSWQDAQAGHAQFVTKLSAKA